MYEFDRKKSQSNKEKHGIDFETALRLWEDPNRVVAPARSFDEDRHFLIARLNSSIWTSIYTYRDENIRIISVRRSRENEKEIYYSL